MAGAGQSGHNILLYDMVDGQRASAELGYIQSFQATK